MRTPPSDDSRPEKSKSRRPKHPLIWLVIAVVLVAVGWHWYQAQKQPQQTHGSSTSSAAKSQPTAPEQFNKQQYSLSDPMSIWVVVNKLRPIAPKNYTPPDLAVPNLPERIAGTQVSQKVVPQMTAMFKAARVAGAPLRISSGYRSYAYQVGLYGTYVKISGQQQADAESARPGYSEHQTGLAADLSPLDGTCSVEQCFANTTAGKWLAANAYKYGFIVRYPNGFMGVTGYEYEPWHVRYVGVDLATEMHKEGIQTLEQFFGLPAAPDYQ